MADERDDKTLGDDAQAGPGRGPKGALTPQPRRVDHEASERGLDVAQEVARVVNLLQRLEKLHAKPAPVSAATAQPARSEPAPSQPNARTVACPGPSVPQFALSQLKAPPATPASTSAQRPPPLPSRDGPATADPGLQTAANPPPLKGPWPTPERLTRHAEVPADFATLVATQTPISTIRTPDGPKAPASPVVLGLLVALSAAGAAWGILRLQAPVGLSPSAELVAQPASTPIKSTPLAPSARAFEAAAFPADTATTAQAASPTAQAASPTAQAASPTAQAASPTAQATGCAATLASTPDGAVTLALSDRARANQPITVRVEDVRYTTAFDAEGRLAFEAPLLSKRALVSWDLADGSSCHKPAEWTAAAPLLRLALIWTGSEALDLHVIEPNAWFGGPTGHVSSANPNADLSHGVGHLQTYGQDRDGTKIAVYAVDSRQIAAGAVLNAFVKSSATEKSQPGVADCGSPTRPLRASQIPYQLFILRSGPDRTDIDQETKSFSMAIPPCGSLNEARERSERIIVKN